MKVVTISDTHNKHRELQLPQADMIIHAGDISGSGKIAEVDNFLQWFSSLDYSYKLFIAGNHDWYFEENISQPSHLIPDNIIYLNDSGVELEGIKIWGSPVQPFFYDWAFNRQRGSDIDKHWQLIPNNTDILITHGPAYGILDKTIYGDLAGCEELLKKIKEVKPKVHISGHIHEGYGQVELEGIHFINASVLNEHYQLVNKPIEFTI